MWMISHFAPFDGANTNSSKIVCDSLKRDGFIWTEALPVSFKRSWQVLQSYLESHDIDGILALGQAEERQRVCLERVALNWIDASIPDEDGEKPVDRLISPGAPDLWTDLPVRAWPELQISYSAGTYVCNYLYYKMLEWAKRSGKNALFVHFPILESQKEKRFESAPKLPDREAFALFEKVLSGLENFKSGPSKQP